MVYRLSKRESGKGNMKKTIAVVILGILFVSVLPMFTTHVQADSGDPSIQDVGITFWDLSTCLQGPITASTGGQLRLWYYIVNPNPDPVNLILGATIRDSLYNPIDDPANDKPVTVSPGGFYYSRVFDIPSDARLDTYDVAYGIWTGDMGRQIQREWRLGWLIVTDPVELTLSSSTTDGSSANIGTIKYDDVAYALPAAVPAETRMHSIEAIPPSGYLLDHWESSQQTPISDQNYGFANLYVHGSGEVTAVFQSGPSFDLHYQSPSNNVKPGGSIKLYPMVNSVNGFEGWIDLSLGWPNGKPSWVLDDSFSVDHFYLSSGSGYTSILTISVDDSADPGLYHPVLMATSGSQMRSIELDITVLRLCHVTFIITYCEIIVDNRAYGPSYYPQTSVTFDWWGNEYHSFHMTSPFYFGIDYEIYVFKTWNDGCQNNYRTWGDSQTPYSDATYYPIYDRYSSFPYAMSAGGGGIVVKTPAQGTYGWLVGTTLTITAIPSEGMVFDHWTLKTTYSSDELYIGNQNPMAAGAGPPNVILTAYFSQPAPPKPVAVLSIQNEDNTFQVGETASFSGQGSTTYEEAYIVSYWFDFGDGQNSGWISSWTVNHAYNTPGDWWAKLKVEDNYGTESDWSTPVEIHVISNGDFEISVLPDHQSVSLAGSIEYEITVTSRNGFNSPVSLSIAMTPSANIGTELEPSPVTPAPNSIVKSKLTIQTYSDTPAQTYEIHVTGTCNEKTKISQPATLKVYAVKSIETVVTINEFTTVIPTTGLLFSIQQNFVVPAKYEVINGAYVITDYWWIQNCIRVRESGGSYQMEAVYNIYFDKYNSPTPLNPEKWGASSYFQFKNTVVMRTTVYDTQSGPHVKIENDFASWDIPPPDHDQWLGFIAPDAEEHPEIVIVGAGGYSNPMVHFMPPTTGHIDAYFLLSPSNWVSANLESTEKTTTAEYSYGLVFYDKTTTEPVGNFESNLDSYYLDDYRGFIIWPDHESSPVAPPDVPVRSSSTSTLMIDLACPARVDLYDSTGHHDGFNQMTNELEANIPDTVISCTVETESITIFNPSGTYKLCVFGTGSGTYHLEVLYQDESGNSLTLLSSSDTTSEGETEVHRLYAPAAGNPVVDDTPPNTQLAIGMPKYATSTSTFVTGNSFLTLSADDGTGSGVAETAYRIFNSTYDSGWTHYATPFNLSSLSDGSYTLAFNSTDKAGNIETTNTFNLTLFSWTSIFHDSDARGTTLKINTQYKLFQFTAPAKDFGVKCDAKMIQLKQVIIICYDDKEMRLAATATDDKTCLAIAWDKQTCKNYWLIEHPPTYTLTVFCKDSKGKAVSGASVYINGNYQGVTDSSGKLAIANITAGTCTVTAKKGGYKDTSVNVTVTGDKTITITMK